MLPVYGIRLVASQMFRNAMRRNISKAATKVLSAALKATTDCHRAGRPLNDRNVLDSKADASRCNSKLDLTDLQSDSGQVGDVERLINRASTPNHTRRPSMPNG